MAKKKLTTLVPLSQQPHWIEALFNDGSWRAVPGLLYSTKETAQEGMERIQSHGPRHKLRVRPWRSPTLKKAA